MAAGEEDRASRLARMARETLEGDRRQGWFIPYRYADQLPEAAPENPVIARLFAAAEDRFAELLGEIDRLAADLRAIGEMDTPPQPRWSQGWFPRLDAAALYAMVRSRAPRRILEVGSGHSTRFAARALADAGLEAAHVAFDPAPRADIDALGIELERRLLAPGDAPRFAALAPGDFVIVDSSHLLMPGTDVDLLFNMLLPLVPAGTIVHVHDVFLPDDYPPAWRWRGYGEQLAVAAWLGAGAARPLFASHYVKTRMFPVFQRSVAAELPLFRGAIENSLWLEKTSPAVTAD